MTRVDVALIVALWVGFLCGKLPNDNWWIGLIIASFVFGFFAQVLQ